MFSSVQGALLRRRELTTTRFVLPSSSGDTISPLSSNPSPFPFSTVTRRVASHRPTFIRGSLSSSQERQPSVRSPQPALLKSRPARVPSQGWQKNRKLFAQTRGLSFRNTQLFPRIARFPPGTHHFFPHCSTSLRNGTNSLLHCTTSSAGLCDFFCVSSSHSPLTLQRVNPLPPSFIHNVLSSYVYLPSIRCPRRPLRHESRYRRRSPRRMGTINRDRRITPDHR